MAAMTSCKRAWALHEEQGGANLQAHFLENELVEREFDGELLTEDEMGCEPEPDTCEEHAEEQVSVNVVSPDSVAVDGVSDRWATIAPRYKFVKALGRGGYGEVIMAHDLLRKRRVAIKRISGLPNDSCLAESTFREIHLLRSIKHEGVVELHQVFFRPSRKAPDEAFLVLECMSTDLRKVIHDDCEELSESQVRSFILQLLRTLRVIHKAGVLHRDLKPSNILRSGDQVKIADFGLGRFVPDWSPEEAASARSRGNQRQTRALAKLETRKLERKMTFHVVTRSYRAPEVILCQEYGTPVDVWALGCIFAEMLGTREGFCSPARRKLFSGARCYPLSNTRLDWRSDSREQMKVITDIIGTPSAEEIAAVKDEIWREYFNRLPRRQAMDLGVRYRRASEEALDLLESMLTFDPAKRITVDEALDHPYFEDVSRSVRFKGTRSYPPRASAMEAAEVASGDPDWIQEILDQALLVNRRGGCDVDFNEPREAGSFVKKEQKPPASTESGATSPLQGRKRGRGKRPRSEDSGSGRNRRKRLE